MSAREVYLAADPVNAEIVKDMLADRGIAAHVRRQHLWGGMGELPANLYPGVWVDAADYERARTLVVQFEAGPMDAGPDWTCPGCRERIEGTFQACWRCQHPRPTD
ncbi:DUF2007 domain-containing protein [Salinisphaera sp. Q1T1-3]|uniref:putative signal transducing protein n=1 Tax=Salinisphaera sp. Q1T1-3 TaxID=2321229 RepID=UPI000E762097|nr:DUF2007 domain-containing protein [Salinisphaera sp. Q1T1-3]RJS91587.1 DUF2007 domain-containing protein [Salinisphaera sp. Q1T1-3]